MKYLVLLCTVFAVCNCAYADDSLTILQSAPNKGQLINKYIQFSNMLGAAESRCSSLNEVINKGWKDARTVMLSDLISSGLDKDEASFMLDRAYQTSKSAPSDMPIISDCESVLSKMYLFKQEYQSR